MPARSWRSSVSSNRWQVRSGGTLPHSAHCGRRMDIWAEVRICVQRPFLCKAPSRLSTRVIHKPHHLSTDLSTGKCGGGWPVRRYGWGATARHFYTFRPTFPQISRVYPRLGERTAMEWSEGVLWNASADFARIRVSTPNVDKPVGTWECRGGSIMPLVMVDGRGAGGRSREVQLVARQQVLHVVLRLERGDLHGVRRAVGVGQAQRVHLAEAILEARRRDQHQRLCR